MRVQVPADPRSFCFCLNTNPEFWVKFLQTLSMRLSGAWRASLNHMDPRTQRQSAAWWKREGDRSQRCPLHPSPLKRHRSNPRTISCRSGCNHSWQLSPCRQQGSCFLIGWKGSLSLTDCPSVHQSSPRRWETLWPFSLAETHTERKTDSERQRKTRILNHTKCFCISHKGSMC